MQVLVICKFKRGRINSNQEKEEKSIWRLMVDKFILRSRIWFKIKLIPALLHVVSSIPAKMEKIESEM